MGKCKHRNIEKKFQDEAALVDEVIELDSARH